MQIVEFTEKWITAASRLVMENYLEERSIIPALPETPALPALDALAQNGLGVAAVEGDILLGFLGAYGPWDRVFCIQGLRGVFSPIHAHGAVRQDRTKIYQRMYQAAARKWVAAGAVSHAITLFAHDSAAHDAFFCYGFGMRCMDLIRNITDSSSTQEDHCCYELPVSRHRELRALRKALSDHLANSPCFMSQSPDILEDWLRRRESQPPRVFVAEQNGHIAAYIEITEDGENFAVSNACTRNICGAYCLPEYRGNGIAHSLLCHIQQTLHREGYSHLGVDCESFNPTALYFWNKHFSVYTHSLVRRIDETAVAG